MDNLRLPEKFPRTLGTSPEETDPNDLEVFFRHLRFSEGLLTALNYVLTKSWLTSLNNFFKIHLLLNMEFYSMSLK